MNILYIIIPSAFFFVLGIIVAISQYNRYESARNKRKRSKSQTQDQTDYEQPQKKSVGKKIGTMNLILIILGIGIFLFIIKMIQLFEMFGSVPDSLITCFFGAATGEISIMGLIKNSNNKHLDRKWQLEDREWSKKNAADAANNLPRNDL